MKNLAFTTFAVGILFASSAMAQTQFAWTPTNSKQVDTTIGKVPQGSLKGGHNGPIEPVPNDSLYVCRGNYKNSVHPGKLWKSWCHIGWGGKEVLLDTFEVLTTKPGRLGLKWVPTYSAKDAVQGGYNDMSEGFGGYPLFICRVSYQNGVHPGKLWKGNCNIGWGGKEIPFDKYEVLTLTGQP